MIVECEFTNTNHEKLLELKIEKLGFANPEVRVIPADEIASFIQKQQPSREQRNREGTLVLSGLILASAVASGGKAPPAGAGAVAGMAVGAMAVGASSQVGNSENASKRNTRFSEKHILSGMEYIPAGSTVKKYVVLDIPKKSLITKMEMSFARPAQETLTVPVEITAGRYRSRN